MDDLNLRSTLESPPSPNEIAAINLSIDDIVENVQRLRDQIASSLPVGQLTFSYEGLVLDSKYNSDVIFRQVAELLKNLPRLTETEVIGLGHGTPQ